LGIGWQKIMRKLWVRLSAALLLLLTLVIVILAAVMNGTIETSFRQYVSQSNSVQAAQRTVQMLEAYYRENATWEGVSSVIPGPGVRSDGQTGEGRGSQQGGVRYTVIDQQGIIVYSRDEAVIGAIASDELLATALPMTLDDSPIGWLHAESPGQFVLNQAQQDFLKNIRNSLLLVGLSTAMLALLLGILLSRIITSSLALLQDAAQEVAGGNLGRQVSTSKHDAEEIISLTESFNRMSEALAKGEQQRQQMAADVAHELRTPVSVIRTQLQAILDGVHEASIEQIAAAYDQAIHLQRLVEDLRTLTQAESGHLPLVKQPLDLGALLRQIAQSFEPLAVDAGFTLSTDIPGDLPAIMADKDRLQQVLANLLTNALRYTEPSGTITLSASSDDKTVHVAISNSGVTLTPAEAERVFDRFWRADGSRQRDDGGSGLGLSIARQIVKLHDGHIRVELDQEQTHFIFELPF
jgi:two-component system sensor histidine kinase BaeS